MLTKEDYIAILELKPHVGGGYYRRVYEHAKPADGQAGGPGLSSSIYYLLDRSETSMFHRLTSDETWLYHCGDPLDLYLITDSADDSQSTLEIHSIGVDLTAGQRPQFTIPANRTFGAKHQPAKRVSNPLEPTYGFTLVSCVVSPEFSYDQYQLFTVQDIRKRYGQLAGLKYFFE